MADWLTPIPEDVRCRLGKWAPPAAVAEITMLAKLYKVPAQNPVSRKTLDELDSLSRDIVSLIERLHGLSDEAGNVIALANAERHIGDKMAVRSALRHFDNAVAVASQYVEARLKPCGGAPASSRTWLAKMVAAELEKHRVDVDARPNGALCQVLGIIFDWADENPPSQSGIKSLASRTVQNPPSG